MATQEAGTEALAAELRQLQQTVEELRTQTGLEAVELRARVRALENEVAKLRRQAAEQFDLIEPRRGGGQKQRGTRRQQPGAKRPEPPASEDA